MNVPVAYSIIPIRGLLWDSNGRYQDQLRHVLWVLQSVRGSKIAAHAAEWSLVLAYTLYLHHKTRQATCDPRTQSAADLGRGACR